MGVRVFLSVMLAFIVLEAQAEGSQWLTNMIAEHEQSSEHKAVQSSNKKDQGFFSTHGLILFYGSQCPHCKQFAPTLNQWVARNKVELLPLSLEPDLVVPEYSRDPRFLPPFRRSVFCSQAWL